MSGDFAAFVTILEEVRLRVKTRILAYCLMAWKQSHYGPGWRRVPKTGSGRVSAAALFDKLTTAPAWTPNRVQLANGLLARPAGWVERVNAIVAKEELERLRSCVRRRSTSSRLRSRPFAGRCLGAADAAAAGLGINAARSVAAKKAVAPQRRRIRGCFLAAARARSVPMMLSRANSSKRGAPRACLVQKRMRTSFAAWEHCILTTSAKPDGGVSDYGTSTLRSRRQVADPTSRRSAS